MAGDVRASGPMFDGTADSDLQRGIVEARHRVAAEGEKLVHQAFAGQIRVDRGRFLGSVTTTDQTRTYTSPGGHKAYTMTVTVDSSADTVVTTDLATYGPWLEGVGSRNQTTRFKGYHGFRMASQTLDGMAGHIAEEALAPYIGEMND